MELSLKDLQELIGNNAPPIDNNMVGKYVLVRCRDAGVHCGVLESYSGRECVLTESRLLWYWKPIKGAFLSSVTEHGLDSSSKVGEPQARIHLTENCAIAQCSSAAEASIRGQSNHNS